MRVSYNDEIPVSSLAACVFHMPLLGYTWLQRCASLFLRCSRAREVTLSPFCTIRSVYHHPPVLLFNSMLSAVQITSGILPMNAQLLHAD